MGGYRDAVTSFSLVAASPRMRKGGDNVTRDWKGRQTEDQGRLRQVGRDERQGAKPLASGKAKGGGSFDRSGSRSTSLGSR